MYYSLKKLTKGRQRFILWNIQRIQIKECLLRFHWFLLQDILLWLFCLGYYYLFFRNSWLLCFLCFFKELSDLSSWFICSRMCFNNSTKFLFPFFRFLLFRLKFFNKLLAKFIQKNFGFASFKSFWGKTWFSTNPFPANCETGRTVDCTLLYNGLGLNDFQLIISDLPSETRYTI